MERLEILEILVTTNKGVAGFKTCGRTVDLGCRGINCVECPLNPEGVTLQSVREEYKLLTAPPKATAETYTGGSSDYYQVEITKTTTEGRPAYTAECNDIIEALNMNFAEGNAFKALWRRAAQRTLGLRKAGSKDDGLYDAEKVEFFGARLVAQSKGLSDETE